MARLTKDQVEAGLRAGLPGWTITASAIRKEYAFQGFKGAVAFVDRLVEPANAARHHPDLEIHYDRVVVTLSTHDEGGITDKDLDLARTVEALAEG